MLAGHAAHAAAPGEDAFVPAAHLSHAVAPAGALLPAVQKAQLVAPLAFWARPAGQSSHGAPRKDALANRPGAQKVQAAPEAALPGGHAEALATQPVPLGWLSWLPLQGAHRAAAPTPDVIENVPGGQVRQAEGEDALVAALNLPAPHCVQPTLPGAAHEPAAQHTAAPGALPVPAAQGAQEEEEVTAGNALKRPAAQGRQSEALQLPMAALNVPAGQGVGVVEYTGQ